MCHRLFDLKHFAETTQTTYLADIRAAHPHAFTRQRKLTPYPLLLQMFSQKGKSQFSELLDFYSAQGERPSVSTVGFYKARMKFNPHAVYLMMRDYMTKTYQEDANELAKLNGYLITAIDGSVFTLPSTEENAAIYGRTDPSNPNSAVQGKLSMLYDCVNKLVIDSFIGPRAANERKCARQHLAVLKQRLVQPTITIFDRGYFSMQLVDYLTENHQKFVIRLDKQKLKRYSTQLQSGEDKQFNVTFNRVQTNQYRDDPTFRAKLMTTQYVLRFVKIPLTNQKTGHQYDEILLTNLPESEFDLVGLRELYRLRWGIETAYNTLKNKMKLEEFSGTRDWLIQQDIYCCIWLYNVTMLIILDNNFVKKRPEDQYKYQMRPNISIAIGIVKTCFLPIILSTDRSVHNKYVTILDKLINEYLVPVRNKRTSHRKHPVNKSRYSYRYTY